MNATAGATTPTPGPDPDRPPADADEFWCPAGLARDAVFRVHEPADAYQYLAAVRADAAAAVHGRPAACPLMADGLPAVMACEPERPGGLAVVPPVYVVTPTGAIPSTA